MLKTLERIGRSRTRGQDTVELSLLALGGALLVVGAYTIFNPLIQQIGTKITTEFGLLK
jgi:hypothetical protein